MDQINYALRRIIKNTCRTKTGTGNQNTQSYVKTTKSQKHMKED